jgi:hypothetical protein
VREGGLTGLYLREGGGAAGIRGKPSNVFPGHDAGPGNRVLMIFGSPASCSGPPRGVDLISGARPISCHWLCFRRFHQTCGAVRFRPALTHSVDSRSSTPAPRLIDPFNRWSASAAVRQSGEVPAPYRSPRDHAGNGVTSSTTPPLTWNHEAGLGDKGCSGPRCPGRVWLMPTPRTRWHR